jgi:hypothetical protein
MYKLLKTLHPGRIRTRDLLFCRWTPPGQMPALDEFKVANFFREK